MESDVRKRLDWIKLYDSTANLGLICRRCGISRPTLRKWVQRYKELGVAGLSEHSRRPRCIKTEITPEDISNILILRKSRTFGHRSIAREMKHLHGRSFSTATIQKILERHNCKCLKIKHMYKKKQTGIAGRYQEIVFTWMSVRLCLGFTSTRT